MLWILASLAIALLCYEMLTLVTAVLVPLLGNPNVIQTDFHYYYLAAQRFSADSSQLYSAGDDVIAGFAYPPPAILPFVALAKLSLGQALIVMTIASYGVLIVAVRQWARYLDRQGITTDRKSLIAITLVVLSLGPTYMNAIFGQVNAFVVASAVAFVALAEALPFAAGTVLALGAWLKIYPALLLWVGAWDRRACRAIGCALAALLVIAAASLLWVPWSAYEVFASFVLPSRSARTAIHVTNQSLVAFLERFRYEPYLFLNWTGQQAVNISPLVSAVNFALLGISCAMLAKGGRSPRRAAHAVASLMALVALCAPLGWGHTYVMALPLVVLRLIALRSAGPVVAALTVGCVAALMIPAGRHLPIDAFPGWLQNIVYSR
ncbi:MAG TPA: glycosyltransferase family 87 protein, partial [Vicinamibacterales bacterium]|nr:glycosyltransferase family 87 protein [Vicinamibacterales bacterium]